MFDCTHCGHSEMAHVNFVGRCCHGEMKPKDGEDCSCPGMDHKPGDVVTGSAVPQPSTLNPTGDES